MYVNKSCYLLGSPFIHFLICEWSDSYDIMLLSIGVSWRYKKWDIAHKTNRFNRKKLHVPPRTVNVTAGSVQHIIHTGLCRVCWLLVFVHWAVWVRVSYSDYATGYKIQVLDPSRDMWFFSSLIYPDRLWDHPAFYSEGTGILPGGGGVKWLGRGVDHSFLFSGKG